MASLIELSVNYSPMYAFWCIVEYNTDYWGNTGWLNRIAQKQMNKISLKKKGKEVFQIE